MGIAYNTSIVRDGLITFIDVPNQKCYSGSGMIYKDLSGNDKNANAIGAIFNSTDKSVYFDGVNDTLTFGTGNTYFPLPQFTISLWFRSFGTTETTGTAPGLFGFTYGIRSIVRNSYIQFGVDNGTSLTLINSVGSIPFYEGNWYNVAFYHSGVEKGIYINGEFNNSALSPWSGTSRWPTNTWNLGRDNNNTSQFFRGEISSYQLYNRVLTQEEIKTNFEAMRGRYGI